MPRCLMAKKWKAYPWADREGDPQNLDTTTTIIATTTTHLPTEEDEEEIDVVGDVNECHNNNNNNTNRCWAPIPAPNTWGPSSPTAGATAPSPPPAQGTMDIAGRITVLYTDHVQEPVHYTTYMSQPYHEDTTTRKTYTNLQSDMNQQRPPVVVSTLSQTSPQPVEKWQEKRYQVLSSLENKSEIIQDVSGHKIILVTPPHDKPYQPEIVEKPDNIPPVEEPQIKDMMPKPGKKSLAMCFTSTGAALSLPPKKKDIYRPYSLEDRPTVLKTGSAISTPPLEEMKPLEPIPSPEVRYETDNLTLTVGHIIEVGQTQTIESVTTDGQLVVEQQTLPPDYQHRENVICKTVDQENYYEDRLQKETVTYSEADSSYQRDDYYQRDEREYRYDERSFDRYSRPAEDISAAHAILDLSASTTIFPPSVQESHPNPNLSPSPNSNSNPNPNPNPNPSPSPNPNQTTIPEPNPERTFKVSTPTQNKTVAYTYEAFFVSDGRSKKKSTGPALPDSTNGEGSENKAKYTCTECGKQYATSSNLSRHKQTHRSLDSQSAKKCMTCGKAYVSMPALSMHVLTHKLSHGCGVCGKLFSRPWLLQGHLRSHTGEKPYGCAHCGKAFADRSNLRAHMQTHSIDKNYVCSRCNKSFALKSYLNKHLESACFKDTSAKDGETSSGIDVAPLTPPQSPTPVITYAA